MARKARVEFDGALYHVLERGDRQESIFSDDAGTDYDFGYGYDGMGRLQTLYREEDQLSDIFDYNPAGELREAKYGAGWDGTAYVNEHRKVTYHLDDAGNREGAAGVDENGNQLAYTPDLLNQYTLANSNPVVNGSQHELTDHAGVQYQYIGDTQLRSATSAAGTYEAGYDALGRLVRRTTNRQSTFYAFDGAHAIMEYNPGGTVVANSLYGQGMDELIARNDGGREEFFHQDRLGNVSAVTGAYGVLLEQYRYDAYGAPRFFGPQGVELQRSRINNRFLFTGREWVQNYGFYEFRARAYNPALGRFMSEDPLGLTAGDANLFRYCAGDPVNYVDPYGEDAEVGVVGPNVNIRTTLSFWGGAQNYGPAYVQYATQRLNNQTFGSFHVTFATGGGPSNSYRLEAGTGAGEATKWPWEKGATNAKSFIGGLGAGFTISGADVFLHEFLHLLGAKDHYNLRTGVPDPGFEDNIMGGPNARGSEINQRNIQDIINSGGRGVAGGFFARGGVFFGHNPDTGRALFNNGSGWQPIGNAPADIRWAPNSGTGNWQADQATKNYLLGGGTMGSTGEGFHPVPSSLF